MISIPDSLEDWRHFEAKYKEIVDPNAAFDDPVPPTEGYTLSNGQRTPYHAGHGDRGRGVFASRDIKKGELVEDEGMAEHPSQLVFPSGMAWREYIFALPRTMGE